MGKNARRSAHAGNQTPVGEVAMRPTVKSDRTNAPLEMKLDKWKTWVYAATVLG